MKTAVREISNQEFQDFIIQVLKTMTPAKLATTIGVSIPTVERWATGRNTPHQFMRPGILAELAKIKNPESGFSLIEVMISAAILTVVMTGIMQATYVAMLTSTTADVKNSVASVAGYVGQIALNPAACTAAITKVSQNYGTPIRFDLPDGQVIAANSNLQPYGIYVAGFTFQNPSLAGTGFDGSKAYFGTMTLNLATKKQVIGPSTFAPRAVASVYLTVSPAGQITACGALAPTLPQAPTPPAAPASTGPSDDFKKGCSDIGGEMSGGNCTFHSQGRN